MRFLWSRFIGLNLWLLAALVVVMYLIGSFPAYIANALIGNYGFVAAVAILLIITGNAFLSITK